MKKSKKTGKVLVSFLACLALTCTSAVVLTACNVADDSTPILHEHVWNDGETTKEATCTQEGEKTYTCTVENCNETKISILPKTPHAWDEGTVTTTATCTQEGVKTYTCTVCDTTKTEKIAKTAHDWNENDECTICHTKLSYSFGADLLQKGTYKEEIPVGDTVYVVYANENKDVSVEDKSGSFDDGAKTFTKAIKLNGKANPTGENAISRVIGMTFKKAGSITVYVDTGGSNKHVALYDGEGALVLQQDLGSSALKYLFLIPAAGTYYVGGDTDTGSLYVYGIDFSEETVHIHSWDEGSVTTPATCIAAGVKTYACSGCSETKTESLPKIAHNYENGVCAVCGVNKTSVMDMSGLALGKVTEDAAMGSMFTLTATTEKYSTVVENGASFGGEDFTTAILLGGKLNATADNIAGNTCSRGIKVVLPARGTVTLVVAANTATNLISMCDGIELENYVLGAKNAVGKYIFTAENAGTYYFGTTTGTAYVYKVTAEYLYDHTEHVWNEGEITTPATCTAEGEKTYICTVCGDTRTEKVDMLPHSLSAVNEVNATCTETGVKAHKECTNCHKLFDESGKETAAEILVIPALGHTWDGGVVTKEPTFDTDGVKTYTCTVCGKTKTESVPMTGEHKWDNGVITTPATCTSEGVKTYTCTEEGCVNVTKTEVVPVVPAAHNLKDVEETAAACFANGVVAHKECEYCHKLFTTDGEETTLESLSTIPYDKVSHHYEQGVCTVCGKAKVITADFAGVTNTTEDTVIDGTFSILATTEKPIEVKASDATADGIRFVNRVTLGGVGTMPGNGESAAGYRVLKVTVEGPCTIIVYAKKNQGSYINIGQNAGETTLAISADGNEQALKSEIIKYEFVVTAAGTYYIGTTKSSCYLYYAAVQYPTNTALHSVCEGYYDDGVTTAATCVAEGKTIYTCLVCGKSKETTLPVDSAAHKLTTVAAKAATCAEKGNVEHEKCEYCGKLFLNGEEVESSAVETDMISAHILADVDAVTGTCTTNGVAAHKECSVCHKVFTLDGEETTLEALSTTGSHTYENHVCTVCGAGEVVSTDFSTVTNTTENTIIDGTFGILATSDKNIEVSATTATADGIQFVNRITLGGKGVMPGSGEGATGYRVLEVTTDGPCTIILYVKKNKGSYINIGQNGGETTADIAADGNEQDLKSEITKHEFVVTAAGTYYIGTTGSSCYLYYAAVQYPAAEQAEA